MLLLTKYFFLVKECIRLICRSIRRRMGKFYSERVIREYCDEIWKVQPVKIDLQDYVQADAGLKVDSQKILAFQ